MSDKKYSELITLPTFRDRFNYLSLNGRVGDLTFNGHRYLNQKLYQCPEWKTIRRRVIIRDQGRDLACEGYDLIDHILIHHLNPITVADVVERKPCVFDLENLICTCLETHNAIHYGDATMLSKELTIRTKNDTCPWR